MMILRSSPPSPFGRKVRIALSLLGLDNEVPSAADTGDPTTACARGIRSARFPVLIAEDGSAIR